MDSTLQRNRITAISLVRQLELGTKQPQTHVHRLKLQATAQHVKELLETLDEATAVVLRQRLVKAEAALESQAVQVPRPSPPSISVFDSDFLAPTAPVLPRSRPSSPASASSAPYSNAYPYAAAGPEDDTMSPPRHSVSTSYELNQPHQEGRLRADSAATTTSATGPRSMRSSSISGLDDYEPDAYSPTRSRASTIERRPIVDLSNDDEPGHRRLGPNGRNDHDELDPEAGFGPKVVVDDEDDFDPEAGLGAPRRLDYDHDDFDPEAGDFVPPPRPSSRTKSPGSAISPPPRRGSVSSNHRSNTAVGLSPQSSMRQRPSAGQRRGSSRSDKDLDRDRDELLRTGPGSATSSDLLSHHHDMQSNLLSSLTTLSSQLKQSSMAFGENLEKDKAVMEHAQGKLETNHDKMKAQSGKLGVLKKKSRGTTCWTIGVVAVVAVAWVMMFLLIKVT